ncbi:MAG: sodium:calcium antiporter [Pelosinus sp.]|nr:sodium:calcium antiporter [Pelosinus sp.]
MFGTYLALIIAVLVIYYSCELFINGIEWVGKKFSVSESAVGTILAAFGTALPESVVTFVAVAINSTAEQKDIGVGAALGGPLVLGTIAYAVVGICLLLFRSKRKIGTEIDIDSKKLSRDQEWFVSIFIFKVLLGLFLFSFKPILGFLFLAAYGLYFYKEMRAECDDTCRHLEPLKFQPRKLEPSTFWVMLQTLLALVLIFTSSQVFVKNLELVSSYFNISPIVVSLLLSPVATELPEILNAVIWVRQGKETLALGNISGAMMIQATVPSAFGIFFTPWLFDAHLIWSGIVTLLSVFYLLSVLKKDKLSPQRLIYAGFGYVLFAAIFIFYPA